MAGRNTTRQAPVSARLGRWLGASVWAALLGLGTSVSALGAAELRLVTWNVENGVGAPGSAEFAAVRESLERLRPDVIAFQEIDAHTPVPTNAAHFADLRSLLTTLGFGTTRTHLATAGDGFQSQPFVSGDFGNTSQCLAVASRHPILRTVQIGRGVAGRREHTRFPLAVTIDVPGTERPLTLVTLHFKQGDTQADEFRRGVEAYRVREFLLHAGLTGDSNLVVVAGDMNEEMNEPQSTSFPVRGVAGGQIFGDGSRLPDGYGLGPDVPDPLAYAGFPATAFAPAGLVVVPATQTDGVTDRTYNWAGNARLDYILASEAIRHAGAVRTEVYHSGREPVGDGLPKAPDVPDPVLSLTASDHLPVVADVPLEPSPSLVITLPTSATVVAFEPSPVPVAGTVTLSTALAAPLTVAIAPYRDAPVLPITPVVIPAGERQAAFAVTLAGSPFAHDRRVSLLARAPGCRDGLGTLVTRATGVGGPLLISQYTETPSGSSPKAVEVMNITARAIDFAAEPLQLLSYASGASSGAPEVTIETGRLPPGAVVVVGDATTAQFLVSQGLLSATSAEITRAETGTVFTDTGRPEGRVVFVKRGFQFNGDDALEVRLNARRCDVFGTLGHDPGTAWSGGGVSTTNQNLSRRADALVPSAGWTNPSLLFETTATTLAGALAGFGMAPALEDPYATWAAARGLTGPAATFDADPDGNGMANGIEFVFGERGPELVPVVPAGNPSEWHLGSPVRNRLGSLRWGVAVSERAGPWRTIWEETSLLAPPAGDFRPVLLRRPATGPFGLARVFVIRP